MTAICPHCGYDLKADKPIERDDVRIEPFTRRVWWKGNEHRLSPVEFIMLSGLVKASPQCLGAETLADRIGYEGDDPDNNIKVYAHRLRRKLPGIPLMTVWGRGYAWRPKEVISCA